MCSFCKNAVFFLKGTCKPTNTFEKSNEKNNKSESIASKTCSLPTPLFLEQFLLTLQYRSAGLAWLCLWV